jgi:hypothetical protein
MDDQFMTKLFIKGLKAQTSAEVQLREPANLMKAIEYAQIIDDTRFSHSNNKAKNNNNHHY